MATTRATLLLLILSFGGCAMAATARTPEEQQAARIFQELLTLRPEISAGIAGGIDPREQRREQLYMQLKELGAAAVTVLSQELRNPQDHARQHAALALMVLTATWYQPPLRLDISAAVPDLIESLQDPNARIRTFAHHAIEGIGPKAAAAVPLLLLSLQHGDVGSRVLACIALSGIGSAASEAIPAVRRALGDPNEEVRHFARLAIGKL